MNARNQAAATKTNTPATPKKKPNAFANMASLLGKGADDLMKEGDKFAMVPLSEITVLAQVREEFSDEENTDAEMDESVQKHGVFTPVLLRPTPNGPRPYELCAGERRYRSSERTKKETIPALIRDMTDEQFSDMQFAENVQRKNLTIFENAKRIQKDLDTLGSVEAVLAKHNKGRPWLSKVLSLLKLPEQTQRLVSENVTADTEVINKVKTIEKINPEKARELVDELAETRGKVDARQTADKVLAEVKPASAEKAAKKAQKQAAKEAAAAKPAAAATPTDGGTVATAPDESAKEPGEIIDVDFASAKQDDYVQPSSNSSTANAPQAGQSAPPALPPKESLDRAYSLIKDNGANPRMVLDMMSDVEKQDVTTWLASLYEAGTQAPNMTVGVVKGFRNETFAAEGCGAFALIAFLHGADSDVKSFNVLNVLGLAKT